MIYKQLNQMIVDDSHNPLYTVINHLIINPEMNVRSHLMVRSKQQLKNQLLMGFRKKQKEQFVDLMQTQQRTDICQTPMQSQYQSVSSFAQNRSILDEFSKCPIREEEYQYSGQKFLNKFMFSKKRVYMPTSAKNSVSVQTERPYQNEKGISTKEKQAIANMQAKTPQKITSFDERADKSLINVSGNLSTYKFMESNNKKDENKILPDNILQSYQKQKDFHDSAQHLLKQLGGLKQNEIEVDPTQMLQDLPSSSLEIAKVISDQQVIQRKEPMIKKIHLSRSSNKSQGPPFNKNQQFKQNAKLNNHEEYPEDEQQSQKIRKLLSKKSSIKSMIVQKNKEEREKQKRLSDTTEQVPQGKWGRPSKKNMADKNITKKISSQEQEDPLDWLPPYESSSSGLQAVIQQQNQSEMEESVKHKKDLNKTQNPKIHNKTIDHHEQKQKREFEKKQSGIKPSIDKSGLHQQQIGVKQGGFKKMDKKQQQSLKSISLSDLDLQDVSQIQHVSSNKDISSTFKKKSQKQIGEQQLPDYHDPDHDIKQNQNQINLKKYIVNDISNDIKNLKDKIQKDSSNFDRPNQSTNQKGSKKKSSDQGSQGQDKKMSSMLDFFDQVHDKIDFKQISKDIIDLKDRIQRDSQ